jgi:hypothetical protein
VDFDGYLPQGGRVLSTVMRAEQQFPASGQQDPMAPAAGRQRNRPVRRSLRVPSPAAGPGRHSVAGAGRPDAAAISR